MRYTGPEDTSHAIARSLEGDERQWAVPVLEGLMSENFPVVSILSSKDVSPS